MDLTAWPTSRACSGADERAWARAASRLAVDSSKLPGRARVGGRVDPRPPRAQVAPRCTCTLVRRRVFEFLLKLRTNAVMRASAETATHPLETTGLCLIADLAEFRAELRAVAFLACRAYGCFVLRVRVHLHRDTGSRESWP